MPVHPVTKDELEGAIDGAVGLLRGEITGAKDELRGEITGAKEELRGEIAGAKDELRGEIAGAKEELRGEIAGAKDELRGEIAGAKDELRGEIAGAKDELRGEIHRSVDGAVSLLRGEMRVMEKNLVRHIADASEHTARVVEERVVERLGSELARHVKASEERNRELVRGLDDRYRDLPDRTAALRRDLDAHVADDTRHLGPRAGGVDRDR